MGVVRYKRGDLKAFVRYAKRALEIDQSSDAAALLAFVLAETGITDDARRYAEMALYRDPLSFFAYWGGGALEIFLGRPDLALARLDSAPGQLSSNEPFPLWWEAQAAGYAGNEARAREKLAEVVEMEAGFLSDMSELLSRALSDDRHGVKEVLKQTAVCEMAQTDEYFPLYIANALARVGELDEALTWLEQAVSWGFTNHDFLSKHNRYLEPLRGMQRFEALIEVARKKQREFVT